MAPVAAAVANAGICAPQQNRPARELDRAVPPTFGATVVRMARSEDVRFVLGIAEALIGPGLTSEGVLQRIVAWRRDSLWTFVRHGRVVGGLAMLMLNSMGLDALLAGGMDTREPKTEFLAASPEIPAAIYLWGGAHSFASDGMVRMLVRLQSAPYESADIYAAPVTLSGLRFLQRWGFQLLPGHPRNLHQYVRLTNRPLKLGG
jgi:hypothetical protein